MKYLFLAGAAAILGTGYFMFDFHTPANVYPLTPQQVYDKLRTADLTPSGTAAYGRIPVTVSGEPGKSITWTARGECTTLIAPHDGGGSELNVTCPNIGEGAAAGLETAMRRKRTIELVDATLKDRAYDPDAAIGRTAANWPTDSVHHGDIFDAQSEALAMSAETEAQLQASRTATKKPKPPGW